MTAARRTAFVEWLDRQMLERDLRPVDIRPAIGIASGGMSEWYSKGKMPSRINALKLARYLSVPEEEVLSLTGHLPPDAFEEPVALEWADFGEQLAADGDDAEIMQAAVAALATLPAAVRGVMRAYLRTAAGQVLQAAALHKAGAAVDWESIALPPEDTAD